MGPGYQFYGSCLYYWVVAWVVLGRKVRQAKLGFRLNSATQRSPREAISVNKLYPKY